MCYRKSTKARNQPLAGEVGRHGDGEDGGSSGTNQVLRRSQPIECISNEWEVFLASVGEPESARVAHEQLQAEAGLQHVHLMADRALRLIEFFGRSGEAQGPGGSLKGSQGGQRWWDPSRQEVEISTSFELHLGSIFPSTAYQRSFKAVLWGSCWYAR